MDALYISSREWMQCFSHFNYSRCADYFDAIFSNNDSSINSFGHGRTNDALTRHDLHSNEGYNGKGSLTF